MTSPAYIALNDAQQWTLFAGDGTEDEQSPLVYGPDFEVGAAIREAITALATWAHENGYTIVVPHHHNQRITLGDLVDPAQEPALYDELVENGYFGD